MTYTTIEQVENYIKDTLLQSATFKLEKQTKIIHNMEHQLKYVIMK